MNSERASGIILRVRPLTDTSLIVHWLCPEAGRMGTVAKGARTAKSSFAGKLDTGFEAEFAFQRSKRSDLHALREVVVRSMNTGLRADYAKLTHWAYGVNLVEAMTETETPLPEVFDLVVGFLHHLASTPPQPRNILALELRVLSVLGLEPESEGDEALLIRDLIDLPWSELPGLVPTGAAVRRLRASVTNALMSHLGRLPRGRSECLGG